MCNIIKIRYAICKHSIHHTWSACRGHAKWPGTKYAACVKSSSICLYISGECGQCVKDRHQRAIMRELKLSRVPTAEEYDEVDRLMIPIKKRFPTNNVWFAPLPPNYGRYGAKRSKTKRTKSLLSQEWNIDEIELPPAWESIIVGSSDGPTTVYETDSSEWDWEQTPGTKSLSEEIAENAAQSGDGSDYEFSDGEEDSTDWFNFDEPTDAAHDATMSEHDIHDLCEKSADSSLEHIDSPTRRLIHAG